MLDTPIAIVYVSDVEFGNLSQNCMGLFKCHFKAKNLLRA